MRSLGAAGVDRPTHAIGWTDPAPGRLLLGPELVVREITWTVGGGASPR